MSTPPTPSVRDIAGQYTDGGISVLPIRCDGSKAPAVGSWRNLQDRIGTATELDSWFAGNVGIGVIGGQISGGLEILDFDEPGKFDQFAVNMVGIDSSLLPRLPKVATPSSGHHVYLRCDEIEGNQKLAMSADNQVMIETRGQGGYVVAPGSPASCHTTGRTYRHVGGPPIQDTPRISVAERRSLLDCARAFDERPAQQPAQQFTPPQKRNGTAPGEDFGARHSWADILVPHGWVQVSPDMWRRPGKTSGGASASSQTTSEAGNSLLRVFSSNAHPFESDQSYSKFAAFAILQHGGDYSAAAKTLAESGYGDQVANVELVFGGNGAVQPVVASPELKPFRLDEITAAQLASTDWTQSYLVTDMLTELEVCIMAGAKKAMKTNTLCDLAISLATATPFLGRFSVPEQKMVGFISGESGGKTLAETLSRVCDSKNIAGDPLELRFIDKFILSMRMPQIEAPAHMMELARWIQEHGVQVLLLDPAYLCISGEDSGNLMAQGAKLRRVADVCNEAGVTLVLAHHTKKNTGRENYDVPELEDIAWAGFAEFARQWLLIGRRERYEPGTGSHRLWFNYGGSAGHSGLWGLDIEEGIPSDDGGRRWEVDVLSAQDARDAATQDKEDEKASKLEERFIECRRRVHEAVKAGPETITQLRVMTGVKAAEFSDVISCLLKDQLIETCELKKGNGQTYEGYRTFTQNTQNGTQNSVLAGVTSTHPVQGP